MEGVSGDDDSVKEVIHGVTDFRQVFLHFEGQDKMPRDLGGKLSPCLLFFLDVCFSDEINSRDLLEYPVLEELKLADAQVVDECLSLEHPDRNFNVDDRNVVLDFLWKKGKAKREKANKQQGKDYDVLSASGSSFICFGFHNLTSCVYPNSKQWE